MAIQIKQIPGNIATITSPLTYNKLQPTNWSQILPVSVANNLDRSEANSIYKHKYILEVYKDSISDANKIAKLKQRRNNYATTTNTVSIFDIRAVVNTTLSITQADQNATGFQIQKLGKNVGVTDKIFSKNSNQLKTIKFRGSEEYATTSTGIPVEQSEYVTITMYFTQATFDLFNQAEPSPLSTSSFVMGSSASRFMSDTPLFDDYKKNNLAIGGASRLEGRINYINKLYDFHTLCFQNYDSFGSAGDFAILKYYDSNGVQVGSTYAFPNDADRGGIAPDDGSIDDAGRLLYFGCGTANLEGYTGDAHKDGAGLSTFDGQPSAVGTWDYYIIYLASNDTGVTPKSLYYYFVQYGNTADTLNCKGMEVVRLTWKNSLGAWDYFNFKGGVRRRVDLERKNYSSLLGSSSLDSNFAYKYYNWEAGNKTLYTKGKMSATLTTDFLNTDEARLLEFLFKSNEVKVVENKTNTLFDPSSIAMSQPVVITNKTYEIKKTIDLKAQVQYTFEVQYSNDINTNS